MKTLMRTMVLGTSVCLLSLLPAGASADSVADRKSETPINTWGVPTASTHDAAIERSIFEDTLPATAAGGSAYSGSIESKANSIPNASHRSEDTASTGHYENTYKASDYKRDMFGGN